MLRTNLCFILNIGSYRLFFKKGINEDGPIYLEKIGSIGFCCRNLGSDLWHFVLILLFLSCHEIIIYSMFNIECCPSLSDSTSRIFSALFFKFCLHLTLGLFFFSKYDWLFMEYEAHEKKLDHFCIWVSSLAIFKNFWISIESVCYFSFLVIYHWKSL